MSFRPYPEYEDSGVNWLDDVPAHWNTQRLKLMCTITPSNVDKKSRDDEPAVRLCNYTDVYKNEQITRALDFMPATASQEQIARLTLKEGDTLITKDSETADDIAVSAYVPESLPGVVCGYHLAIVRPRPGVHGRYVKRFFDSAFARARFAVEANGLTRFGLSQSALDNVECPCPPTKEQERIADFLDFETAKIDALVAEQEMLIALLKEKRQALISHAVTKGLDPAAPMKDSGIEWLGDVPAHWETRTLAKVSTKITNGFVGPTRDILVNSGVPYIQATHIKDGRINFDDGYFVRDEWSRAHAKSILCVEDVLIVQTGAGTGDVGLVTESEVGFNCHALIIISPERAVLRGDFLSAALWSAYGQARLASIQTGAMHPHLNCGNVKFIEIAFPALDEQASIVSKIRETERRFEALTAESRRAMALLKERRSALISAAVTGKIDVRNHVSAAPMESAP